MISSSKMIGFVPTKDGNRARKRPRRRRWLPITLATALVVLVWVGVGFGWWYYKIRPESFQAEANNHVPEGPRVAAGQAVEQPEPRKEQPPPKAEASRGFRRNPPKRAGPELRILVFCRAGG